jgi:hypothetical protein
MGEGAIRGKPAFPYKRAASRPGGRGGAEDRGAGWSVGGPETVFTVPEPPMENRPPSRFTQGNVE